MTFYEKVLDNDDVGHHFDNTEMPKLIDHQTKFVASLMGGPGEVSDERLEVVHRPFPITNAEFDIIIKLLSEALSEHRIEEGDISHIARAMESKRSLIVHRGAE